MLVATTTFLLPRIDGRNTFSWSCGGSEPYMGSGHSFRPCFDSFEDRAAS